MRNTRPRTDCTFCDRDVAIDTRNGSLYKHRRPNGSVCPGSHIHAYPDQDATQPPPGDVPPDDGEGDPSDNSTIGLSGFAVTPPSNAARSELAEWWAQLAQDEIDAVVSKAVEYGATDLRDLGLQILEMAGRRASGDHVDMADEDRYATEVGIAFYAMGKMARIAAAIKEGRQPSYDSWHDLGVYARMAQRVHQVGAWPGAQPTRWVSPQQLEQMIQDGVVMPPESWFEQVRRRLAQAGLS